jgi:hypothetical protein
VSVAKKPITVPSRQRASIAFTDRRSSVVAWTCSLIWESNPGAFANLAAHLSVIGPFFLAITVARRSGSIPRGMVSPAGRRDRLDHGSIGIPGIDPWFVCIPRS